jgi:hypothetical protein
VLAAPVAPVGPVGPITVATTMFQDVPFHFQVVDPEVKVSFTCGELGKSIAMFYVS